MAAPFDILAKEVLDLMLHDVGRLEREYEVAALPAQRGDTRFVPDPRRSAERRALGLLGRMTEGIVLFEAFHQAPSVEQVLECLRKMLNHRHAHLLAPAEGAERMWLLCGGRPDGALRALRATPSQGWPAGFYDLGEAIPLTLVVLSELDDSDDTLPLRLMGAGATLSTALGELRARYGRLPRGRTLFTAVVQVFLAARSRGELLTEADMLDLTEAEEYMRRQHDEGLREGMREGMRLLRIVERKLARLLTDAEEAALSRRVLDDAGAVDASVNSLDGDALARWLAAPDGPGSS